MEEHGPVEKFRVLLISKKEKSSVCHCAAPDETTHDAGWVEKEQEEDWRAEYFPQWGGN